MYLDGMGNLVSLRQQGPSLSAASVAFASIPRSSRKPPILFNLSNILPRAEESKQKMASVGCSESMVDLHQFPVDGN
jgi:hypothetical protein